jgi:predicted ATP-grasp superfamily ATP-dependent carboligase
MRDALLRDLLQISNLTILTTHDARLPAPTQQSLVLSEVIDEKADRWKIWEECISHCDATWVIAPETDGILLRLTKMIEHHGKVLLGCGSSAIMQCASKETSYQLFNTLPYPTPVTYRRQAWQALHASQQLGAWVCKQDDGVGAEDSACFENIDALNTFMQTRQHSHVIQPYVQGQTASLSMLCKKGQAWLLSANLQKTERLASHNLEATQFIYTGSIVNGMVEHWQAFEEIAQQIAYALPDLSGYVGVDVIVNDQTIWLLEINPRLTSSYPALAEATDCNPAQLVIDLICKNDFKMPTITRKRVETFV